MARAKKKSPPKSSSPSSWATWWKRKGRAFTNIFHKGQAAITIATRRKSSVEADLEAEQQGIQGNTGEVGEAVAVPVFPEYEEKSSMKPAVGRANPPRNHSLISVQGNAPEPEVQTNPFPHSPPSEDLTNQPHYEYEDHSCYESGSPSTTEPVSQDFSIPFQIDTLTVGNHSIPLAAEKNVIVRQMGKEVAMLSGYSASKEGSQKQEETPTSRHTNKPSQR